LNLFELARGGVYQAKSCYQDCGALLPHLFTLTPKNKERYFFCGTFPEYETISAGN